jgi:membrane protease YdiL (CAAX protease family)
MKPSLPIKPMGPLLTAVYWAIPAAILYITHYVLAPRLVESGQPYLVAYLTAYVSTMALFLVAALVAYRLEGNAWRWENFKARYRMQQLKGKDWLWALGVLVFIILSYFGLAFTAGWLARSPLFAPHPVFAPEFGPAGAAGRAPGTFMGSSITGSLGVALVFMVGWFFNIFGEELWFRGYILPRQEQAMGGRAWIANGLMFTLNHIWQPWNLLMILPGALFGAWVVQRRANTWILILVHGLANAILLVVILLNGVGIKV